MKDARDKLKYARWFIVKDNRRLRNAMFACGSVDDLVQESFLRDATHTTKAAREKYSWTTTLKNQINWTLFKHLKKRAKRDDWEQATHPLGCKGKAHELPADFIDVDVDAAIESAMSCLTENEYRIIMWRFGLFGCDPLTLQECANRIGRTRERVRQIEAKALQKMRGDINCFKSLFGLAVCFGVI